MDKKIHNIEVGFMEKDEAEAHILSLLREFENTRKYINHSSVSKELTINSLNMTQKSTINMVSTLIAELRFFKVVSIFLMVLVSVLIAILVLGVN